MGSGPEALDRPHEGDAGDEGRPPDGAEDFPAGLRRERSGLEESDRCDGRGQRVRPLERNRARRNHLWTKERRS